METNQVQMHNALEASAPQPAEPQSMQQPQENATELQLRAQELTAQARTILEIAHVDVLAVYNTDPEIRARVLRGEWDFIDVYKQLKPVSAPPAPVRSANGGMGSMNIAAMNENQFEKLNQMLSRGVKVDMR